MGGVVAAIITTREKMANEVAGTDRAVFDEEHVVYPGKPDTLSEISEKALPKRG